MNIKADCSSFSVAQHALTPKVTLPYDTVGGITAYEDGELDREESIELFQALVDSGLAWQLQGSYGRTAQALINAGEITCPS